MPAARRTGRGERPPPARLTPPPLDRSTLSIRVACSGPVDLATLRALERALEAHPDAVDLLFAYAALLDDLGRPRAARRAYDAVLAREPAHVGALTNAGVLAFTNGRHTEALALFRRAVDAQPADPMTQTNLGNVLAGVDADASRAAYERALALDPHHVVARYALGLAFDEPVVHVTASLAVAPLRVLVPYAADGGNLVTTPFFDRHEVTTIAIAAESYRAGAPLPAHDVIVNAVADAERSATALDAVERIVAASGRPCINSPARVRATGRVAMAARLGALPGVVAPRIVAFARDAIDVDAVRAAGFAFPLLVRAPGFHAGKHFTRVMLPDELGPAVDALPGPEILAIAYVDTRDADGWFRKYRMLVIDGALVPLHLAFSRRWNVHYFSADNAVREASRTIERAFLADPRAHLGARTCAALEAVRNALDLDYGGIDFTLAANGDAIVFEANASFAIYLPDDDATAPYRLPATERAVAAVRAMIRERALRGREMMRKDGPLDDGKHVGPA